MSFFVDGRVTANRENEGLMRSLRQCLLGLSLTVLLPLGVAGCAQGVVTTQQQKDLWDRSTLAWQKMLGSSQSKDLVGTLRSARAVIICPQVFKAGVVIGGVGGACGVVGGGGGRIL